MSFCGFIKGITPKIRLLFFVLMNSVLLNLSCVWISLWQVNCLWIVFLKRIALNDVVKWGQEGWWRRAGSFVLQSEVPPSIVTTWMVLTGTCCIWTSDETRASTRMQKDQIHTFKDHCSPRQSLVGYGKHQNKAAFNPQKKLSQQKVSESSNCCSCVDTIRKKKK